jgi:hypothetical protein
MMNVVNLSRASTTYEYRLVKYRQRGFHIYVPGMDKNLINKKLRKTLRHFVNEVYPNISHLLVNTFNTAPENIDEYGAVVYKSRRRRNRESSHINSQIRNKLRRKLMTNLKVSFKGLSYLLIMDKLKYSPEEISDYEICLEELRNKELAIESKKLLGVPDIDRETVKDVFGFEHYRSISTQMVISCDSKGAGKRSRKYGRGSSISSLEKPHVYETLFNIPDDMMSLFGYQIPQKLTWKTSLPGQQMSSTFHKSVYLDKDLWYDGLLYGEMKELGKDYIAVIKMYAKSTVNPDSRNKVNEFILGHNIDTFESFSNILYAFLVPDDIKVKRMSDITWSGSVLYKSLRVPANTTTVPVLTSRYDDYRSRLPNRSRSPSRSRSRSSSRSRSRSPSRSQ